MPIILHIETATEVCSTCLSDGIQILSMKESSEPYIHASFLSNAIASIIKEAGKTMTDLDAVSLSKGPGSFTGLRVGSSTAKGICYALDIPLIAIDTLQSMAHTTAKVFKNNDLFCAMIDARRMEVYRAVFNKENTFLANTSPEILDSFSYNSYFEKKQEVVFFGNGSKKFQAVIDDKYAIFAPTICSAKNLVEMASEKYEKKEFEDIAYFSPSYIKAPNITTPKKIF